MKKYKQTSLAEKVGISDSMLSQILKGPKRPKWLNGKGLAHETGTIPDLWMEGPREIMRAVIKGNPDNLDVSMWLNPIKISNDN